MTKISQLSPIGDSLAIGDQFLIRDIDDAGSPNKSVTISGITRALDTGTALAPALAFASDKNTGLYSPGADQVAVATNGTGRLFIGANPHVGIGVTPNASSASSQVLEVGPSTFSSIGNDCYQGANWFYTGAAYVYKNSAAATQYVQGGGNHIWLTAASGTAGNAATFSERLRITSAGLVGIGTSSPGSSLDVRFGTNPATDNGVGSNALRIFTSSALAADAGGAIALGGVANVSGGSTSWAQIAGRKENATGNNYAGYLQFITNNSVGTMYEHMRIDSSGRVGIGTTSPVGKLHVAGSTVLGDDGTNGRLTVETTTSTVGLYATTTNIGAYEDLEVRAAATIFTTDASTERARIDSSGRLLVGTSTARSNFFSTTLSAKFQVEGANDGNARASSFVYGQSNASGPLLVLGKHRSDSVGGVAVVSANDELGDISFQGSDGTAFAAGARISAFVDGTPGANDMPGRLVFSVTADGSASPTEALRITNDRVVAYNQATPAAVNATATLTVANLKTGIITSTSAAATDMTLPTGTDTEAGFSGLYTNFTFEWTVINTGPSLVRVLAATAHTIVGSGSVATGTSGRFASRRTAANTFVTYRLS